MILKRLERIEERWRSVFRVVVTLLLGAYLAIVLLHDKSPASQGGLVLLLGVLIAIIASTKPITTRKHLQMVREASRSKGFVLRLIGFTIVVVGTCLVLAAEDATFLEEVFAILIMTYVWFCNVLKASGDS